jgi:uncharacterized membrane protein YqjE
MSEPGDSSSEPKTLLGSITRLVDQLVYFVISKLELFQIEVEEEWRRIATMLVLLVSAAVLGLLALMVLTALIVAIAIKFDQFVAALIVLTLIYGGAAGFLASALRTKLNTTRTKLFSTTLGELRKDREWVRKGR